MPERFIEEQKRIREVINDAIEDPANQMVIPHLTVGQAFIAKRPARLGDGGVDKFKTYHFDSFGKEGLKMSTSGTEVTVDYDALMRQGIIEDPAFGSLKVVDIYMPRKK